MFQRNPKTISQGAKIKLFGDQKEFYTSQQTEYWDHWLIIEAVTLSQNRDHVHVEFV